MSEVLVPRFERTFSEWIFTKAVATINLPKVSNRVGDDVLMNVHERLITDKPLLALIRRVGECV